MRPRAVIKRYVFPDAGFRGRGAIVGMQIDFLVHERSPEALDHDVVVRAAFAVHTQHDTVLLTNNLHEVA